MIDSNIITQSGALLLCGKYKKDVCNILLQDQYSVRVGEFRWAACKKTELLTQIYIIKGTTTQAFGEYDNTNFCSEYDLFIL